MVSDRLSVLVEAGQGAGQGATFGQEDRVAPCPAMLLTDVGGVATPDAGPAARDSACGRTAGGSTRDELQPIVQRASAISSIHTTTEAQVVFVL